MGELNKSCSDEAASKVAKAFPPSSKTSVHFFTGGLSVRCFLKTVTTLRAKNGSEGAVASAKASGFIGDAEGLAAHARAARIRLEQ